MEDWKFPKSERLVSTKLMDTLFSGKSSHSATAFPLRVVYMRTDCQPSDAPVQVLISVPKKRFKHAVDRNRVKRQVREAYRHHKQPLIDAVPAGQRLLVAFIWMADRHCPTPLVESKVKNLLRRMAEKP